ncbi:hypothetical protein BH09PAT1_BH09PAT1_0030 [soil metagenome]
MDQRVKNYLEKQHVGVLSISDPDTSIHSAALHYSFNESLPIFLFITERQSEKCKPLLDGSEHQAALVIGFSEEEYKTFQAKGTVRIILEKNPAAWNNYFEKFPERSKMHMSPDYVILQFIPTFWKYSDNKTTPMTKITSNGLAFP